MSNDKLLKIAIYMYFIFMYKLIEDVDVCEMRNGSLVKQKKTTQVAFGKVLFFWVTLSAF